MSSGGYKIGDDKIPHFITFAVSEWIDVFTRQAYKDVLIDSLSYCQEHKGLIIHAWVIMTNHVHLILSAREGFSISDILRDFKKHTSVKITEAIENNPQESRKKWMLELFRQSGKENSRNKHYQFWRQDNHPIELSSDKFIDQRLAYLHNNPVNEGIVSRPQDYLYSSAGDYSGEKGLLEIEYLS